MSLSIGMASWQLAVLAVGQSAHRPRCRDRWERCGPRERAGTRLPLEPAKLQLVMVRMLMPEERVG